MNIRPLGFGGTVNADYQCGYPRDAVALSREVFTVHNSCKDGAPSSWWVVICLPGCRYFHADVRELCPAIEGRAVMRPHDLRRGVVAALNLHAPTAASLWDWAKKKNLPRTLSIEACERGQIPLDDDDRRIAGVIPSLGVVGMKQFAGELVVVSGRPGRARTSRVSDLIKKLPAGARFSILHWPKCHMQDVQRDLRDGLFVIVHTRKKALASFPVKPFRLIEVISVAVA